MADEPIYLTTLDKAQAWLDITPVDGVSKYDVVLTDLLAAVTARIQNYTHQTFFAGSYSELFDGDGESNEIYVTERPVTELTSLHIDSLREYGDGTLIASNCYLWYPTGRIVLLDGSVFPFDYQNVKVKYDAGYETIPADLAEACLKQLSYDFQMRKKENLGSEVLGASRAQSVSYLHEPLLPEVKDILSHYMKISF